MKAQEHNKLLGIFFLVMGGMQLMSMLSCLLIMPMFLSQTSPLRRDANFPVAFFTGIMVGVMVFSLLIGTLYLIAGFGLIKHKPWGRMAGIIAAIPSLLGIPIGTALGIYTLWFMTSEKGKNFYMGGGDEAYLPPPPPQTWSQT
ncbi:MAG TPA: hypothetical protein VGO91_04030 [Pyrinomonadaceae bacterium]|jgi:hypothetical protein|nr:hypothetical protein [Pyrinomonadaceae bacterium]